MTLTHAEFVREMHDLRQEIKNDVDEADDWLDHINARFDDLERSIQVTVYSSAAVFLAAIVTVAQLGWLR